MARYRVTIRPMVSFSTIVDADNPVEALAEALPHFDSDTLRAAIPGWIDGIDDLVVIEPLVPKGEVLRVRLGDY